MKILNRQNKSDVVSSIIDSLHKLPDRFPEIQLISTNRDGLLDSTKTPFEVLAEIRLFKTRYFLAFEAMSIGQPSHIRNHLLILKSRIAQSSADAIPILAAPFLSQRSRSICTENHVGYFDMVGNIHLRLPGALIDIAVPDTPQVEKRTLQSLFRPKAASILRLMLRDPLKPWRVKALAEAVGVSFGQVSNVRQELIKREWGQETPTGIMLFDPNSLLDAWRDAYQEPVGETIELYTSLHGKHFDAVCNDLFSQQGSERHIAFASYSAARWISPYGRSGTEYFYATRHGSNKILEALQGERLHLGANVRIHIPKDEGILNDTIKPTPDVLCTSPLQTYLDLSILGERSIEAAEHLRNQVLKWNR